MSVNEVKLTKAARPFAVLGTSSNPNSKTFCIGDEDHTLGNAVRHVLVRDGTHKHRVSFAGYSVPHPSEPVVHIRVQTAHESSIPAIVALQSACQTLSDQCDHVLDVLEAVLPHVKDDRIQIEQALMEEEYEEDEEEDQDGGERRRQQHHRQSTDRMDEDE
jgi:DNA-directed RNA polymerases I and III subunit RPAC2